MSSATSQLPGASWKVRIKFHPWANVTGRTHTIIIQYNARKHYADYVINLETNYINISVQIDLYMHQSASIYVFVCIYIYNICISRPILYILFYQWWFGVVWGSGIIRWTPGEKNTWTRRLTCDPSQVRTEKCNSFAIFWSTITAVYMR